MSIKLEKKEIKQMQVMEKLKLRLIKQKAGAALLGLSLRQTKRKLAKYRAGGPPALVHGNCGRSSNRAANPQRKAQILKIVSARYRGFGPTFAAEKLKEEFGIIINHGTLRRWMIEIGLWKNGHRKLGKHKKWRMPKEYFGQMIQLDGSKHKWIDVSDEYWTLIKFMDDATNTILWMSFHKNESTESIMDATRNYFQEYGLPFSIYTDKGSVFKVNIYNKENDHITQYARVLKELGVELIHANSPQAKGRIERSFGTDQDRLVKELKLKNIKTMKEANIFIQKYYIPKMNSKFSRPATQEGNLHRMISKNELRNSFCLKSIRIVQNDWTILYKNRFFQIDSSRPAIVRPKDSVSIYEYFNGTIKIKIRTSKIDFKELTERRKMEKIKKLKTPWKKYKPDANHPWRLHSQFNKGKGDISTVIKKGTFLL